MSEGVSPTSPVSDGELYVPPSAGSARGLCGQILAVFNKVASVSYERLKEELLALPVHLCSEIDVVEVVETMYKKAVRPEDAPFHNLYARLIADLVRSCEVDHGATALANSIHKCIVDKCQRRLDEGTKSQEDETGPDGHPLTAAARDARRMKLKNILRANVDFLGHLFLCGMVREDAVAQVLKRYLYGTPIDGATESFRAPDELELEMFCVLLKRVAPQLSGVARDQVPAYMATAREVVDHRESLSMRMKFMLQDLIELAGNNWSACRAQPGHR